MRYNNGNEVKKIRRIFYQISGATAFTAILLFLLDYILAGVIIVALLVLWILVFQSAGFQFIEFISDENKISFRYYNAISFTGTEYNSIDFKRYMLKEALFENSFLGKDIDLEISVVTQKGIADYPSISLLGVPADIRQKIKSELNGKTRE